MGCGVSSIEKERRLSMRRVKPMEKDLIPQETMERLVKLVRNHRMTIGVTDNPKTFILDFKNIDTISLILALKREKAAGRRRIPDMDCIKIISMRDPKDMIVRDFLVDHMPKNIKELHFDTSPKHLGKEFGYYQFELLKWFDRIQNAVYLNGFKMGKGQLELIFKRWYRIETLSFSQWILPNERLMFEGKDAISSGNLKDRCIEYRITVLEILHCRDKNGCDWEANDKGFVSLVKGIMTWQLQKSLEQIIVKDCGISEQKAHDILDQNNSNIKLIGETTADTDELSLGGETDPIERDPSESRKLSNYENLQNNDLDSPSNLAKDDICEKDSSDEDLSLSF